MASNCGATCVVRWVIRFSNSLRGDGEPFDVGEFSAGDLGDQTDLPGQPHRQLPTVP
jgi:hypothetical protein